MNVQYVNSLEASATVVAGKLYAIPATGFWGIDLLPPNIFNEFSGCLEALEHLSVSLIWSSVFIGVFKKRNKLYK